MAQLEAKPYSELEESLRFERLVAEISTFFINLPADQIDGEIEKAQRRVCEFLDLDRSALFQVPEGEPETLLLTHLHQPLRSGENLLCDYRIVLAFHRAFDPAPEPVAAPNSFTAKFRSLYSAQSHPSGGFPVPLNPCG